MKETATLLWQVYALFTLAEIIILTIMGMPLYDATANSFSTLSTGGFSPQTQSIEAYDNPGYEGVISLFMILAGVNFVLHYHWIFAFGRVRAGRTPTAKARLRDPLELPERLKTAVLKLSRDAELRAYLFLFFAATSMIVIGLMVRNDQSLGHSLRLAIFQVASIGTTTGFSTTDYVGGTPGSTPWPYALLFILMMLMFIGGCAGSTAGGMKIVRISVMLKALRRELIRVIHPRAVLPLKMGPRTLPEGLVRSVAVFFFIYILLFMAGALAVSALEPELDLMESMSASIASLSNIGPGLGTFGPAGTYGDLSSPTQLILVLLMWLGRLEIITGLLLFFPSSYKD